MEETEVGQEYWNQMWNNKKEAETLKSSQKFSVVDVMCGNTTPKGCSC